MSHETELIEEEEWNVLLKLRFGAFLLPCLVFIIIQLVGFFFFTLEDLRVFIGDCEYLLSYVC